MLKEVIPKNKFWATDVVSFPKLEDNADGTPIPLHRGRKAGIIPVCIDTDNLIYKFADADSKQIHSVTADGVILEEGVGKDYQTNLAESEFTVLGSPYLQPTTKYWMVLEGDYSYDVSNCLYWVKGIVDGEYTGEAGYYIDGSDTWNALTGEFGFYIRGRTNINDTDDRVMVSFQYANPELVYLRDSSTRKRLAQSFTTLSEGFYVSRITLNAVKLGSPTGNIWMKILSDDAPETSIGTASLNTDMISVGMNPVLSWTLRASPSKIEVDATGKKNPDTSSMDNVADIIEDVYVNVLGGDADDLNATDFAALKSAKTEALSIYQATEIEFGAFLQKLELGQMFRFLPNNAGEYTVKMFESGDTSTLHFRDEDYKSFVMRRNWKAVFQRVKIKYNDNPSNQEFGIVESSSEVADFIYQNRETLTIETYLADKADAQDLADSYIHLLEYPIIECDFTVAGGYGMDLIPMDKVKLTRSRAMYSGGSLDGILFRIMSITKDAISGRVSFKCVLDSQTY